MCASSVLDLANLLITQLKPFHLHERSASFQWSDALQQWKTADLKQRHWST